MNPCPICSCEIEYNSLSGRDGSGVRCPRCGNYNITGTALVNLRNTHLTRRQRANISGWLSENECYEINSHNLDNFLVGISSPAFIDKSDKLLKHLSQQSDHAGKSIGFDESFISRSYCIDDSELMAVLEYLSETSRVIKLGRTNVDLRECKYLIKPNGWIRLEEISKSKSESSQGFVAMWFAEEMRAIYDEAIAPAIMKAGYTPHRVDLREHNDKIDDEIISQIRRSKFLVADFTGHRGGVYYEAGFAKGLGLEVFWLCSEDDLENLHFDIRQYNCITWSRRDLDELSNRLALRIESVIGAGPG